MADAREYVEQVKRFAEWAERVPAEAKGRLDAALQGGKDALRTGDAGGIRKALDELNAAYSAAGAALYQSTQTAGAQAGTEQAPGTEPGAQPGAAQEDVVEADYEIVDENK